MFECPHRGRVVVADLREQLQRTLGSTYSLERELGGGGMSRVFVAEETRLGRKVVVKVLNPTLAASISAERFKREIRLAARLQQANIVPVLSAGETDGLPYYTMPLVDGPSLRARLQRDADLPTVEVVSVLKDVARALAYAHENGVVHRDIKPENILLSGGAAVVTDFGIAKAINASRATAFPLPASGTAPAWDDATVTDVAASVGVLGTPGYMAPEQASGEPVDHRADIYAWGVTAYELLGGAHPFAGKRTIRALVAAHITERPRPLDAERPDLPHALCSLVMRTLEKDPERRPKSAGEVLQVLDGMSTGDATAGTGADRPHWTRRAMRTAAVLLLVATASALTQRWLSGPSSADAAMLAVLPFENLGPAEDDYFADGITEEITSRLAQISGLGVVGRASVLRYKGRTTPLRHIARELGVRYVLEGTVRWEKLPDGASKVRVNPRLIRASDQTTIWSAPLDGVLADVFELQSGIAERVAGALNVALLGPEQRPATARPTQNMEAYDAYLRGLANSTRPKRADPFGRRAAVELFERAVSLDSNFAAAHARLAIAYLALAYFEADTPWLARAKVSANRAFTLDSTLLEARLARVQYLWQSTRLVEALAELERARRRYPRSGELLHQLGRVQDAVGRPNAALASFRQAEMLDPLSPDPRGEMAGVYELRRRFAETIRLRERTLALAPDHASGYLWLAQAYVLAGDTATARRVIERGVAAVGRERIARLAPGVARSGGGPLFVWWLQWLALDRQTMAALDTLSPSASGIESPEVYSLFKGRLERWQGRGERARAHYDAAARLFEPSVGRDSSDVGTLLGLGEAYAALGRTDEALHLAERAVELSRVRGHPQPRVRSSVIVHAAYIELLAGRSRAARERLEQALAMPSILSHAALRLAPIWAPLLQDRGVRAPPRGRAITTTDDHRAQSTPPPPPTARAQASARSDR